MPLQHLIAGDFEEFAHALVREALDYKDRGSSVGYVPTGRAYRADGKADAILPSGVFGRPTGSLPGLVLFLTRQQKRRTTRPLEKTYDLTCFVISKPRQHRIQLNSYFYITVSWSKRTSTQSEKKSQSDSPYGSLVLQCLNLWRISDTSIFFGAGSGAVLLLELNTVKMKQLYWKRLVSRSCQRE